VRVSRWVERLVRLCRLATGAAFVVLIVAVTVQVLGRSVFNDSPVWTEELTRFALLFLAAFGAGLSLRSGDLVNVDLLSNALPGKGPRRLRLISAAATAALCALLLPSAWAYMRIGAFQTSSALGWRMDVIHGSILVLLATLGLFAAIRVIAMVLGDADGRPEARPSDD